MSLEYQQLLAAADASGSRSKRRELLKCMRMSKVRAPRVVLRHGLAALRQGGLGAEAWTLREQVLLAALDAAQPEEAARQLAALQRQFPGSVRVARLQGMALEQRGDAEGAGDLYAELLQETPGNALATKRQICVLKAAGQTSAAIEALNAYLANFAADASAWGELGELYLTVGAHRRAAFCLEEQLLAEPMSFGLHCRLAELLYTMGGEENLRSSRKYFAQSYHLNKRNPRAVVGMAMAAAALARSSKAAASHGRFALEDKDVNDEIHALAGEQLAVLYGAAGDAGGAARAAAVLKEQEPTLAAAGGTRR